MRMRISYPPPPLRWNLSALWQIVRFARTATPTVLIVPNSRRLLRGVRTIGLPAINTVADGAGCNLPPFAHAMTSMPTAVRLTRPAGRQRSRLGLVARPREWRCNCRSCLAHPTESAVTAGAKPRGNRNFATSPAH